MFLDVTAVAERYDVSKSCIRAWIDRKVFPMPLRLGDKIMRWPLAQLEAWEQEGCPIPVKESENVSNPEGRRCIR